MEWARICTRPTPGRLRQLTDQFRQGVARDGRAFLGRAIVEQTIGRGPGEQHGHAAKAPVLDDLGEPEARLVIARVEAMHIEQDVAVRADAAGKMRREFGRETGLVEPAPAHKRKMFRRVRRADRGALQLPDPVCGRHADHLQRIPRLPVIAGFARRAAFALARRDDEDGDLARARRGVADLLHAHRGAARKAKRAKTGADERQQPEVKNLPIQRLAGESSPRRAILSQPHFSTLGSRAGEPRESLARKEHTGLKRLA